MKKKPAAGSLWEVTADMFLSEQEVESLLKFVRGRDRSADDESCVREAVDRLIVEILLFSGLRNSELCQLRVADLTVGPRQSALSVAGTPRQDRIVFIPRALSDDIVRYVERIRPGCLPEGASSRDLSLPLILNERGRPYDRTALYRRVVRILSDAGLEDRASVQLLRHTYGFLAYKRTGGNLLFVQRQLGHAHPMVTAVYSQFVKFSDIDLADKVAGEANVQMRSTEKRSARKSRKKGIEQ